MGTVFELRDPDDYIFFILTLSSTKGVVVVVNTYLLV